MVMKKINMFFKNVNTLHTVTRPVLISARCFGVFPVSGLSSATANNLRFSLKSPYTVFLFFSILCQITLTGMGLTYMFHKGASIRIINKFINAAGGMICTLVTLRFAKNWPEVIQEVNFIQKSLPRFNQRNVKFTCVIVASWVFLSAIVDQILAVKFYSKLTSVCVNANSMTESYYLYTTPLAAEYVPFNFWTFLIVQLTLAQIVFILNFTDVLIIIMSLYLSTFFEELNDLVNLYKDKSPSIWNILRDHYTKLTRLVKLIDDSIGPFILFSFGINMGLICIQLFKILRKDLAHATSNCDESRLHEVLTGVERTLYFHFSIAFLIVRAVVTALFATRVHIAAKAPLSTLYEVPPLCYNNETRRFAEQINASNVALSGQHFFYVTRGMILTMVATGFTYELVLLQFSGDPK